MSEAIMKLTDVLQRDLHTIQSVANNAANTVTNGYRAERNFSAIDGVQPGLISAAQTIAISNHEGAKAITQRPLDFVIVGDGWFSVKTGEGIRYTRDGHFMVSNLGILTTQSGHPVLSDDGEIALGDETFAMNMNGTLETKSGVSHQLRIASVAIKDLATDGLYAGDEIGINANAKVMQGALERSNVDVAQEMIRMMETTRHFESVQRAISAYDQMLNIGINELGK